VASREDPQVPGPGVLLWALGREELADPLSPERLERYHPVWAEDALGMAPWQEVSVSWCSTCEKESWWHSTRYCGGTVVVAGPCSSSLDVARPLAENHAIGAWDSVLAVSQWAGRGQLRRSWNSPAGNIYGALVLPPTPREYDSLLPVVLGYCLAGFLRSKNLFACVKWPNDILLGGLKVGGVLVEERRGICVAGIGLNLVNAPPREVLRQEHAVAAGCLSDAGLSATPLALWCELVDFVKICYGNVLIQGAPGRAASLAEPLIAWLGQEVVVREGGQEPWTGLIVGLAQDGALRVRPTGGVGERLLTSGSIWRAP